MGTMRQLQINQQTELFFNTINLSGELLEKARKECAKAEVEILTFFINNHTQSFTPLEVCDRVGGLFTSVRRAITNLTNRGYLEKTEEQKKERYGKVNFCWKIKL